MNNKILLGIFALLLVIYFASKMLGGNQKSSFDPQIVQVDTSSVDKIIIHPKGAPDQTFTLDRSSGKWVAKNSMMQVDAVAGSVSSLLNQLTSIRAKRVVSKSPDKWGSYEVDEGSGTRVEVFSNGKSIEDFIVGAFKYDQTTQSASSYIRNTSKDDVFVVDGFLAMSFNQQFNNFRNKQLFKVNQNDITEVSLTNGPDRQTFQKIDGQWFFAGMEAVDSTNMAGYINGLASVNGSEFADQFRASNAQIVQQLDIEANNLMQELKVTAYANPIGDKPFVIHSTMNPEAYFYSDSTGLYQKLFGKLSDLKSGQGDF
jgi:hypothetical protein